MAERRRAKQKKKEDLHDKPSKEEYAVAKFLRFNLPPKEGKLVGMTVQYFIASKAVDMLMDSQWSSAKSKSDILFTSRNSCVDYLHVLLVKGLFHRAAKVEKKKDKETKKKKKGIKDSELDESGKEEDKRKKKTKKSKEKTKEEEEKAKVEEKTKGEEKEEETEKDKKDEEKKEEKDDKKEEEKKKSKKDKKIKLEMHELQIFKDGDAEYYVWIYDPVPVKTFIIGLFLVLGAIAVCLFPLWPPEVRLGVYYLSLAAAGFVGVILSLCVIRLVLFCMVWGITFGKHHFWFLPNLTEDVGFFDSFKPLYKHDAMHAEKEEKDKDSKEEEEKSTKEEQEGDGEKGGEEKKSEDVEKESGGSEGENDLENDNGYEVIGREELDEETEAKYKEETEAKDKEEEEEEEEDEENEDQDSNQENDETKKDK